MEEEILVYYIVYLFKQHKAYRNSAYINNSAYAAL